MKRTHWKLAARTFALCAMGALVLECGGDDSNNNTGTGGGAGTAGSGGSGGTGGKEGGMGGAGGADASAGSGGMGTGGARDASLDGAGGGGTGGSGGAAGSDAAAPTEGGGVDAGSITPVVQVLVDGATIPKYVEPLPTMSGRRVTGATVAVDMVEFQQKILPASFYTGLSAPYTAGTTLWGYKINNGAPSWPATTIEAQQGTETVATYTNSLQAANGGPPSLARYLTTDLTLHWADPIGYTAANNCMSDPPIPEACLNAYAGPVPTVVHLHGAEVLSDFDGQPDTWFTPGLALKGPGYVSNVYHYPNRQEATTLWFHDHALGRTRINVYSGLAGFYLVRDARDTGLAGNAPNLPAGDFEQEIMISDRQFDRNGQLFFPNGLPRNPIGFNGPPPNPDHHPYWNPEFFGDVIAVNGKSWPYMTVEPRAYRFRILDGSNARFYRMHFEDTTPLPDGGVAPDGGVLPTPAIYQIGSDGGFLNAPQRLNNPYAPDGDNILFLAPAERSDVIIDFSGHAGRTFTLINDANAPFPSGDPPDPNTAGQIMQFRVAATLADGGTAPAFNPASVTLRAAPIVNVKPGGGGITPNKTRQLVLVEVEGPGGPLEVLLNNTHWDGVREGTTTAIPGSMANNGNNSTELPQVSSTETWEIANLTEDAHPIHIHLIQFQLINREPLLIDPAGGEDQPTFYRATYDAAFPGGMFIPGYGPPLPYVPAADAGANAVLGGNPPFGPFDPAGPTGPDGTEAGWKDTIKMLPKTVTRIAIRFAPQATPRNGAMAAVPGTNLFSFDPTAAGPGYAWHCHILDHEDNEMMRPYLLTH